MSATTRGEPSVPIAGHAQFPNAADAENHPIAIARRRHFSPTGQRLGRVWTLSYDSCHLEQGQTAIVTCQNANVSTSYLPYGRLCKSATKERARPSGSTRCW